MIHNFATFGHYLTPFALILPCFKHFSDFLRFFVISGFLSEEKLVESVLKKNNFSVYRYCKPSGPRHWAFSGPVDGSYILCKLAKPFSSLLVF